MKIWSDLKKLSIMDLAVLKVVIGILSLELKLSPEVGIDSIVKNKISTINSKEILLSH